MRIKHRVGAFIAACTLTVAGIVGISSPAFAWHYCSNSVLYSNGMYLWPNQGYCPSNGGDYWSDPSGGFYLNFHCYNITGGLDNGSAAAYNTSRSYGIRYWNAYNCGGAQTLSLRVGESTPDLFAVGCYHSLSSFMWVFDA